MAKIIWDCEFIPPGNMGDKVHDIRYIATREGAQSIDRDMAMELMGGEEHIQYMSTRPGVQHYDSTLIDELEHGLFNAGGKANIAAELERLHQNPDSQMWHCVLSLKREDADRLGYDDIPAWQALLQRSMPSIAKLYSITPGNVVWNAAFHPVDKHGLDHHPHVHVQFYSTNPDEGIMNKKETLHAFEKSRSLFTNDMFRGDLEEIKAIQQETRQNLEAAVKAFADDPQRLADSGILEDMERLQGSLPDKGKLNYQYLPKETKTIVSDIVKKLVSLPGAAEEYITLCNTQLAFVEAYNDEPDKITRRMEEWERQFFHPPKNVRAVLHNKVIQTAKAMNASMEAYDIGDYDYVEHEFTPQNWEAPMRDESTPRNWEAPAKDISEKINFRNLSDSLKTEMKWAVGLTVNNDLDRQTIDAIRTVMNEFDGIKSDDIWGLLYGAAYSNLYDAKGQVYEILQWENPELRTALKDETRLDVEIPNQGIPSYEMIDADILPPLAYETEESVNYYARNIAYSIGKPDQKSIDEIEIEFYRQGLQRRFRDILSEHDESLDFTQLKELTGAVKYTVKKTGDNADAILDETSKIFFELARTLPEVNRGAHIGDQLELMANGILAQSYYQVLLEQTAMLYRSGDAELAGWIDEIMPNVYADTQLKDISDEQQKKSSKIIRRLVTVDISDPGVTFLQNQMLRMCVQRRLKEVIETDGDAGLLFRQIPGTVVTYEELEEKYKPRVDRLVTMICQNKPHHKNIDKIREDVVNCLHRARVADITKEFFSDLVNHREEIKTLSNKIHLGTRYAELDTELQSMVDSILPMQTFELDEKGIDKLRDTAMRVIAGERIQVLVKSMPDIEEQLIITHKYTFNELTSGQQTAINELIHSDVRKSTGEEEYGKLRELVINQLYKSHVSDVTTEFYSGVKEMKELIQTFAGKIPPYKQYHELNTEQQLCCLLVHLALKKRI